MTLPVPGCGKETEILEIKLRCGVPMADNSIGFCPRCQAVRECREEIRKAAEALAELEHLQWIEWSKNITVRLLNPVDELLMEKAKTYPEIKKARRLISSKLNSWMQYWGDYSILDEETKDADRVWADKILRVLLGEAK